MEVARKGKKDFHARCIDTQAAAVLKWRDDSPAWQMLPDICSAIYAKDIEEELLEAAVGFMEKRKVLDELVEAIEWLRDETEREKFELEEEGRMQTGDGLSSQASSSDSEEEDSDSDKPIEDEVGGKELGDERIESEGRRETQPIMEEAATKTLPEVLGEALKERSEKRRPEGADGGPGPTKMARLMAEAFEDKGEEG